jgi:hypothetical protein
MKSGAISPNKLIAKLKQDLADLAAEARAAELTANGLRKLNKEIEQAASDLSALLAELDPIKRPVEVFDPGNPRTIGFFIALALTAQPRQLLAALPPHYGSGIYALYYSGDFPLYRPISGTETPIYVGQAAPGNENARTPVEQGARLAARLNEHRKTISRAVTSLRIEDFECRSLVVQTGWETPAEDYLIRLFRPIWNKETKIVQGFGKHGDAPTTRQNKVSSWDVLHQGRDEAGHGVNPLQKTEERLAFELGEHFVKTTIYRSINDILGGFIGGLKQS